MEYGPNDQVQRDLPDAPYEQLAAILRARIERGDWRANRSIASENALREHYGLARATVRKAIALLVEDGTLYVLAKRGTFVAERAPTSEPASEE